MNQTAVRKRKGILHRCLVFCLGLAVGFFMLWIFCSYYLSEVRELDGQTLTACFTCSGFSEETDYGSCVEAELMWDGKAYRVCVYLNGTQAVSPGDSLAGDFRFRLTAGGELGPTYHRGTGIFLLAYQAGAVEYTQGSRGQVKYFPARLRQRLLDLLETLFPQDTVGIARGLLLGDSSKIGYAADTALRVSGIRHIIAVSGLHVTILFGLVYAAGRKRPLPTALIGIPVLLLFSAAAGFTPSVTRACIMQIVMILAMLLRRDYDPPTALAAAVLVILAVNPMAVTSVGFQLSVGSLIGIFLFSGRIQGWLTDDKRLGRFRKKKRLFKLLRWCGASVSVTLGATLVTTPLTAWYFGTVSLVSPLTNLLTLWAVTLIFYGILFACAAGALWLPAGVWIAKLVSWPVRYVVAAAKLLAKFPASALYTSSGYIAAWLVFCYVLVLIFWVSRNRKPVQLVCCAVISLCVALGVSWAQPLMDCCTVTMLDVGQGQCILLQSGGYTYMVDCGGTDPETAADTAAQMLLSQGIDRLDGLVLTHYDDDHAEGALYLLQRISADAVFLPDVADESGMREELTAAAGEDTVQLVSGDLLLSGDGFTMSIFGPGTNISDNESSLCVLFQAGDCDILITGDRSTEGELALLRSVQLPQLEILVAGHHGSQYSTGVLLLEATKPDIVLISVGEDNPYGHPSEEVLQRLALYGCEIYRTDQCGTIVIRR